MRGYKPAKNRRLSLSGVRFIAKWEGFLPDAYLDTIASPPIYTIGYGHTGDVQAGDHVTKLQALNLLRKDARFAADAVRANVDVQVTQHQFDALVSLVFNVGPGEVMNEPTSTLLRLLNIREYRAAADQFKRWSKAGGVTVQGLLNRRLEEAAIFRKPAKRR